MGWYAIDKEYVNYLKKYDEFVPNIDYKNKMKCLWNSISSRIHKSRWNMGFKRNIRT